jgi:hypothetical protein
MLIHAPSDLESSVVPCLVDALERRVVKIRIGPAKQNLLF